MRWTTAMLAAVMVLGVAVLGTSGCKRTDEGPAAMTAIYACRMHPDMMATWPAKCPTCQMEMTKTDTMMPKDHYACKACGMMSTFETKCPKCGMLMTKTTP